MTRTLLHIPCERRVMILRRDPEEPTVVIEEVTDPPEIARHKAWHEKARRNSDWLETHWHEVLPQARDKFLAVAGQQAFIGDTIQEAVAKAKAAHPDDEGLLAQYVRPGGGPRIYTPRVLSFKSDSGPASTLQSHDPCVTTSLPRLHPTSQLHG